MDQSQHAAVTPPGSESKSQILYQLQEQHQLDYNQPRFQSNTRHRNAKHQQVKTHQNQEGTCTENEAEGPDQHFQKNHQFQPNRTQANFFPSPQHQIQLNSSHQQSPRKLTANTNMPLQQSQTPAHGGQGPLQLAGAIPIIITNTGNPASAMHSPFHSQRHFFNPMTATGMVKAQPTNKFYDTTFSKAFLSHSTYEKHNKKIQKYQDEIQRLKEGGRRSPSESDEKSLMMKTQFNKTRFQSKQFHNTERSNEILKVNKNLAEKLYDIQMGKKYVRNKSIIHNNILQPNLSPVGSLSIVYKKKCAKQIDNDNMRLMHRILQADSVINQKKIEDAYMLHKKYKKIAKKAIKQGFDFDKINEATKRHFAHIENKTSSQLFPPILGSHKRSRSTLNDTSIGINLEEIRKKKMQLLQSKNSPVNSSTNIQESRLEAEVSMESENKKIIYEALPMQVSPRMPQGQTKAIIEVAGFESTEENINTTSRRKKKSKPPAIDEEARTGRKKSKRNRKKRDQPQSLGALPNFSMMNSAEEFENPELDKISPKIIHGAVNVQKEETQKKAHGKPNLSEHQQQVLNTKVIKSNILKDKKSFLKYLNEAHNTYNVTHNLQQHPSKESKIKRNMHVTKHEHGGNNTTTANVDDKDSTKNVSSNKKDSTISIPQSKHPFDQQRSSQDQLKTHTHPQNNQYHLQQIDSVHQNQHHHHHHHESESMNEQMIKVFQENSIQLFDELNSKSLDEDDNNEELHKDHHRHVKQSQESATFMKEDPNHQHHHHSKKASQDIHLTLNPRESQNSSLPNQQDPIIDGRENDHTGFYQDQDDNHQKEQQNSNKNSVTQSNSKKQQQSPLQHHHTMIQKPKIMNPQPVLQQSNTFTQSVYKRQTLRQEKNGKRLSDHQVASPEKKDSLMEEHLTSQLGEEVLRKSLEGGQ